MSWYKDVIKRAIEVTDTIWHGACPSLKKEPFNLSKRNIYRQALVDNFVEVLDTDRTGVLPLMFGETNRFSVPIKSPILDDISRKLIENGYRVDIDKKIAYKKSLDRDGKEKWQPISLGKVIGREFGEKTLNEYSNTGKYFIVFSKSAVDVARMSDHMGIESCHSPGGSYFQCAISEGKNGGAVAYVVKADDLNKVSLDDDEIFEDDDRGVGGIRPVARLRLRRIVNEKTGEEIAIPEDRTYGNKIDGFKGTVWSTAREKQAELVEKYKGKSRYDKFEMHGGSYVDTNSRTLVNGFFDDKADTKDLKAVDSDGESNFQLWEREVEEIAQQYDGKFRYFSFYCEVEQVDGGAYLNASVNIAIPYVEFLGLDIKIEFSNWQEQREFLKPIRNILDTVFDDSISEVRIKDRWIYITFDCDINNPDDLRLAYTDHIKEEEKLPKYMKEIRDELLGLGSDFIRDSGNIVDANRFVFQNIQTTEDEEHDFIEFIIVYPIKISPTAGMQSDWEQTAKSNQQRGRAWFPSAEPYGVSAIVAGEMKSLLNNWILPISQTKYISEDTLFGNETRQTNEITQYTVEFNTKNSTVQASIYLHKNTDQHTASHVYEILSGLGKNYQTCLNDLQQIYNNDHYNNVPPAAMRQITPILASRNRGWYTSVFAQ